jgi:HD-like signal output (HDOD) protein
MSLSLRASAVSDEPDAVQLRLRRILDGADFPALSKQIVDTISALDDDAASLQRLANRVLNEYSLTLGVVKTANSVHYRRSGRPVQSATHAMMMLGARTVRQIASGLLLFENYARKSPALKELMLLSLLTANHARETASQLGLMEAEEAHLCGMFRNLGEVLVAAHFPEDYARIQALMADDGRTDVAAAKAVLGFPFADLGVEVCRHWGLPDVVVQGIRARPAAAASRTASVTAFSHDLTQALYRGDGDDAAVASAVGKVLEKHQGHVKLTREQVGAVVTAALKETRELFVSPQVSTDRLRFQQLAKSARAALGESVTVIEDETTSARVPYTSLRAQLRQELEERVAPSSGAGVGEVVLLAIETVLRAGPFDRVIACFLSADRSQLTARTGLGPDVEALMAQFDFPVSVRGGPIVTLTQQRVPIYLPTDRTVTTVEARWMQGMGVRQFGVFPIIVLGKTVGSLYCDRTGEAEVPDRATVRYVKGVVELLVEAIVKRRA